MINPHEDCHHISEDSGIEKSYIIWKMFSKQLGSCENSCHSILGHNSQESICKLEEFIRFAFANSSKEEKIYPLMIFEIANAQNVIQTYAISLSMGVKRA